MKIGIIDADLIGSKNHRFPNLACMKISAYHKRLGHKVDLLMDYKTVTQYDKVFISKVFTETVVPLEVLNLLSVEYGGTGFFYDKAPPLPYEIEHIMPDYSLYDSFVKQALSNGVRKAELAYYTEYSIGFATRGCIRQCSFCVNKNAKSCNLHSRIGEFVDPNRKYICLLDDNIFACKDWRSVFAELEATGKRFQFKQGMDERLLTDEKCKTLFSAKWIGDYIFAFDNIKDKKIIVEKLHLIRKYTDRIPKFYCFCAFNHDSPDTYSTEFWAKDIADLFERIRLLMKNKALPYVMRYKDYEISPYRGMYITVARWCNQPGVFKKKSFREFCEAIGEHSAAVRYMREFEVNHPAIAKTYFDMKWIN